MVGKPNQKIPSAPLQPIPAFGEPFSRVLVDCVGPLPKTRVGNQYLLIDPPHPRVCRMRRLNGAVLRMRPENRGPVSQQVWHDKDPSLLKGPERQS